MVDISPYPSIIPSSITNQAFSMQGSIESSFPLSNWFSFLTLTSCRIFVINNEGIQKLYLSSFTRLNKGCVNYIIQYKKFLNFALRERFKYLHGASFPVKE